MKIAIDAGHGYNTAGKRTPDGIREWTLNNAVATYLAEYLKGYATTFRVDDTTGQTDIKLSVRRNNAINKGAKLLISIHHNALKNKWNKVTGTEVFRHTLYANKEAKELSVKLAEAISKATGLKNRGAKTGLLGVIATSKITCVLCEGGFMDGENDSKYIRTETGQRAYAKAVANTIISYYDLKKVEPKKAYTGTFPNLGSKGYLSKGDKGLNVKRLQQFLNWCINSKLEIDGSFGNVTLTAVKNYQKKYNLTTDGFFGKKSLEKAKTIKK
jgi:N-acetylmuramoyl-L-alanine amidase